MRRVPPRYRTRSPRTTKHIDTSLNLIGGRLGLVDQVFFGRFGVPVMARYLDQRQAKQRGALSEQERDKLLFWFVQAAMWGRFSGSTESFIDQDLAALEGDDGGLDKLLEQLRLWHGRGCGPSRATSRGWRPWRAVLSGAVPPYPHGRSQGLGDRAAAQGEPARQDESSGSTPHLPEGPALQARLQASGSQRSREFLLPDQGHEPGDQRPAAGGILPEV